jgi:hypothetical protein
VENVAVEGACMENDGRMVLDRVSPKGSACVFCPSFCGWIKNKTGGKPVHRSSLVRPFYIRRIRQVSLLICTVHT